ncbi:MAG: UDP-N-acetylglucosamine 1-carboxyvinyltransferase [Clostridia bacterium]|nr:UDP-N-acetylglucosamine 1-carboxyvinyltransferase [Clostridia bacterium]
MTIYEIEGGKPMAGELTAQGAKNSALVLLSAALLAKDVTVLKNCPEIRDVAAQLEILQSLGCVCSREGSTVAVDATGVSSTEVPQELMRQMRSSVTLLGALLGRCGTGSIHTPGGCAIGARPIDYHLQAFADMGVVIEKEGDHLSAAMKQRKDSIVRLPFPSVGATENVMLLAARLPCTTVLSGAAREPEIVDLAKLLNQMGAVVMGAGTDIVTVRGSRCLNGAQHTVLPDRIAAATDLCAAAVTGGSLTLRSVVVRHMGAAIEALIRSGCEIRSEEGAVFLKAPKRLSGMGILRTMPFPGFPTDLQAPFVTLAATADGDSVMVENMFENRYRHVPQLRRMGADISLSGRVALVRGRPLYGGQVEAEDLRGGAALLLAGLHAEGNTKVHDAQHCIERGYECITERWNSIGASIRVQSLA